MQLSSDILSKIDLSLVQVPAPELLQLPEKIIQFGTGVLLRGLPDHFVHNANSNNIFNGRIVVVKSTAKGDTSDFSDQDNLYTVCIRGIKNNRQIEEQYINSSISRVLNASNQWDQILACAEDLNIKIIISNTTEVGITYVEEIIGYGTPASFPAKLLSLLAKRFEIAAGSADSGFVIIPTELIVDNAKILKEIILRLAQHNKLSDSFLNWLNTANRFCNSLVDRIVPGKPDKEQQLLLEDKLGYTDKLMISCEAYSLWAIEGNEEVRKILSFADANKEMIITGNIEQYRELKLRILNGAHILTCGIAFLAGYSTVGSATSDPEMLELISGLMYNEIIPNIPLEIERQVAEKFAADVLDRFKNPFINHKWISISENYSSKLKIRCVPLLANHYRTNNNVPPVTALAFAAYIIFMHVKKLDDGKYFGVKDSIEYPVSDQRAQIFYDLWQSFPPDLVIERIFSGEEYWGLDITNFPGFVSAVQNNMRIINEQGIRAAINIVLSEKQ